MAVVKPFRALRYDEAQAGPLEDARRAALRRDLARAARGAACAQPVQRRPPDPARLRGGGGARPRGVARERHPRRGAAGGLGARAGLRRPGRRRAHALRARRVAEGRAVRDRHRAAARAHARAARRRDGCGSCARRAAQLEPIFLLYDGAAPVERPEREPDLEVEGASSGGSTIRCSSARSTTSSS